MKKDNTFTTTVGTWEIFPLVDNSVAYKLVCGYFLPQKTLHLRGKLFKTSIFQVGHGLVIYSTLQRNFLSTERKHNSNTSGSF